MIFFKYLIKIATFELIEMGDYYKEWFEYTDGETSYSRRFEVMSFDSLSFSVTLGFMALVLVQILLSYLVFFILYIFRRCLHPRLSKIYYRLGTDLFWGTPLMFVIEGYLDIALAIMLYFNS